ncbi:UreD-domain-containing protein [Sporormia fimetaria CBS 119925]|uniref:UreD-domain-containing protein n=1 Tax=Sporormia fimetaria CBS 119925 TaxID=1340428 RepID=A0A6A6UV84_9PLEO|nr:UreD-domain-containing protein [Sporormia fimetaria CBS 119925]
MSFTSPFAASSSKAGHGSIVISVLPPDTPVLADLSYQYPLKLVAPEPLPPPQHREHGGTQPKLIHTVFLLTYGGGIVAGDTIDLSVCLDPNTRLVLLTQGSTKIFKTLDPGVLSKQHMTARITAGSALVYLPDPVQPFAETAFSQSQVYYLEGGEGSLCVCDWVTSGRSARGENWDIYEYRSRNEVWAVNGGADTSTQKRLLLRDNLILNGKGQTNMAFSERMDGYAVFGTLILRGPVFAALAQYFLDEFEALPRIGGRDWGDTAQRELSPHEQQRAQRQLREKADGLIWSAASVRGFTLVKFASRDVQGSRHWLRDMIRDEGTVATTFGHGAMLCLNS